MDRRLRCRQRLHPSTANQTTARRYPAALSAQGPGWITTHPDNLTEEHRLVLKSVLAHCPQLDALTRHVRSFADILTRLQGERLPQWLNDIRADDLPRLHNFAAGFQRDLPAVTAGLTLPWNSGVVEGHINRIKDAQTPNVRPRWIPPPAQTRPPGMTASNRTTELKPEPENRPHLQRIPTALNDRHRDRCRRVVCPVTRRSAR